MKKLAETKLNEDVVVPLDRQIELVRFVGELRDESNLKIGVFGHCGDGNLHVNFMYDESDDEETSRAVHALGELMSKVIELGGAISGEHGVGLAKTPFVRMQFNDAEWRTMKAIKRTLDPSGILNPGKIFDVFKPWEQKKYLLLSLGSIPTKNPNPSNNENPPHPDSCNFICLVSLRNSRGRSFAPLDGCPGQNPEGLLH